MLQCLCYNWDMKLKTFYSNEKIDNTFVLSGQEAVHSIKVYRLGAGDNINIVCGDDNIYTCKIVSVNSQIVAKIENIQKNPANPTTQLTVFQCNLKADKMEYLVQKLTELGATKIVPVLSETVVKKEINKERLLKISKEASKQCGRSSGIEIGNLISFREMINQFGEFDNVFVAYEKEEKQSINGAMSDITGQNCAILIGPEGGFTEKEIELCKNNNVKIFGLGERILRAETAAVAISSMILLKLGEFDL